MPKTKKLKQSNKGKKRRSRRSKSQIGGNLNTKFLKAIEEDDLPYIKENIVNITDLSFENSSGNTPLEIAVTRYNDLNPTEFTGDDEAKLELYNIRTQIIELLLKNGANGDNIVIPRINFDGTNLQNVDLKGADLTGATLENANLDGANLENANLSYVDLQDATIRNANLTKTKFIGANLDGTNINGSNTTETDFTGTLYDQQTMDNVFRTTTDLPQTSDNVFRTTTDLPQTSDNMSIPPYNSDLNESQISSIEADSYDNDDSFDISVGPQTPPYSPPRGNNNNLLLNLMDSYRANNYQSNDENQSQGRMSLSELETEEERNERLLGERNKKRQKYLERPKVTLNINKTNPFEKVGFSSYHAYEMEDVNFCDYITENKDNVIFIYDLQVSVIDKSTIRKLITSETLDNTYIVYECKELSEAFVPHEENIVSGPMLNMRILALNGLTVPLNELDAVVNGEHQIFVIETNNGKKTIPIASLPTRLAMGDAESGQAVVSADHCQAEVSIKVGKISYIENKVLLKQCDKKGGKKKKTRRKKQKKSKRSRKNKKNKKTTKK